MCGPFCCRPTASSESLAAAYRRGWESAEAGEAAPTYERMEDEGYTADEKRQLVAAYRMYILLNGLGGPEQY